MGKINFANIQSALGKAKEAAAPLQNKGHTENVPVDFIVLADRNIYNESDNDESIKELADNIEACGLLHPITVNKIGTEKYQIISGERRFRAIIEYLHWKSVPCMVFEGLSAEAAQLKLCMANLAVREYTTSQKYKFYLEVKALLEKMKASGEYKGGLQKGIAEILNVTKRQVAKYSSIEKLPPDIQLQVIDGTISINKAVDMAVSTHSESESKNDRYMELLSDVLSRLSETNRNRILSGEVDLETLLSLSEKDEPVHHSESGDEKKPSKNEDTTSKKDEPVHLFETDDTKTPSKNEDTESKKNEPVHLFETRMQTQMSTAKPKSQQDGSVLIFKDGTFVPNKIQVLEEHERANAGRNSQESIGICHIIKSHVSLQLFTKPCRRNNRKRRNQYRSQRQPPPKPGMVEARLWI